MPHTFNIPARTETHCAPCEFHKCTGSFHVRIGPGGWREYVCTNPNAYHLDDKGNATTDEQRRIVLEINALQGKDGRYIGKTEKQPDWCPIKGSCCLMCGKPLVEGFAAAGICHRCIDEAK